MKIHCHYIKTLLIILLCSYLFACSSTYKKERKQQYSALSDMSTELPTTYNLRSRLIEEILLARIAAGQQQYETALKHYLAVLETKVELPLINEALLISEKLNDHKNTLFIAELWTTFQPDAVTPWEVIAFYALSDQQLDLSYKALQKVINLESDTNKQLAFFERLSTGPSQEKSLELFTSLFQKNKENLALPLAIARIHQLQNHWSDALAMTSKVINTAPYLLIARKYHGASLIFSGANEEAVNFFEDALDAFPDSDDLRYSLGQLLYEFDRFQDARTQFQQIAKHDPKNNRARYMIAACYYSEKKYSMSRSYFEPLLRIRGHRNPALYYLGEMARNEGDLDTAINIFQQISNSQYYQSAHNMVARLMQQRGRYEEALDYLLTIKKFNDSDSINFKITRLKIMYHQKDIQRAEQYLSQVLAQHPDSMDIQLYHFQWIIEQQQQTAQAVELIPEIITHFQKRTEQKQLIINLASVLQAKGNTVKALDILNTYITDETDVDYRYIRALFAAEIGNISLAEEDLRYILSINPQHIDALNALGYTLADANKNLSEALELIEKAYATNPESPAIVDSMGWVFYRLGDHSKALNYLHKAYNLDTSDEIAAHLAEVLLETGKNNEATDLLTKAIKESPDSKVLINTIEKYQIQINQSIETP